MERAQLLSTLSLIRGGASNFKEGHPKSESDSTQHDGHRASPGNCSAWGYT